MCHCLLYVLVQRVLKMQSGWVLQAPLNKAWPEFVVVAYDYGQGVLPIVRG